MFTSWWRQLVSWVYRRRLQTRKGRRHFASRPFPRGDWVELYIERLEDRITPATDYWTGLSLVGNNWSDSANWSSSLTSNLAIVPSAGDSLVFPAAFAPGSSFVSIDNLTANTNFNSITFQGGGYSVSGNSIALGAGGLTDSGTNSIQPEHHTRR